ncbi:hypothetical protein KQI84_09690 [bacterium]|nr:hypothetical protein [bacterium]
MYRRIVPILGVVLLAVLMAGCNTNRVPRFQWASGEPEQFRRYTGRPAVDYFYRWNDQAFFKVEAHQDDLLTGDKKSVLQRHGQPDYMREGIDARSDETFTEWVYWDRNVLCQFIQNDLVFEGPLMDSDRYLVQYGYPSEAFFQQYEVGPAREIWIYKKMFEKGDWSVSFSDGALVYKADHR